MNKPSEMKSGEIGGRGKATARRAKPEKRPMRSFEAEADVDQLLAEAKKDGISICEICNEALRHHGVEIVSRLLTARVAAAQRWLARAKERPDQLALGGQS